MRAIVTAIVFFKQRTICIINVWGCAEILPFVEFTTESSGICSRDRNRSWFRGTL